MIARIKTETGYYDTVVFAVFRKGWDSQVLILNQANDALELKSIWFPKRNVFIYNTEKSSDWISKKKVEGYDWVLGNVSKRFIKTVINPAILPKCKELQKTFEYFEWFEIKNQNDIEGLMSCAFGFHDSYVKNIYEEAGKQYILFDTTWGCEILFALEGNIETNLFKDFGHFVNEKGEFLEIFDSSMFFKDGLIYWVDDESVQSDSDFDKLKYYYFCANCVKWKLIISGRPIFGNSGEIIYN